MQGKSLEHDRPLTQADEVVKHSVGGCVTRGWLFWSCPGESVSKVFELGRYGRGRSDWGSHGASIIMGRGPGGLDEDSSAQYRLEVSE